MLKYISFIFLWFIIFSNANAQLEVREYWIKRPTACNTKDGILDFIIEGGTPPYKIFQIIKGKEYPISLPISNLAYRPVSDTFFIRDRSKTPLEKEFILFGYYYDPYYKYECIQEIGKPNQYAFNIIPDSFNTPLKTMFRYPFTLYFARWEGNNLFLDSTEITSRQLINFRREFKKSDKFYCEIDDHHGCSCFITINEIPYDTKASLNPSVIYAKEGETVSQNLNLDINIDKKYFFYDFYKNDTFLKADKTLTIPITTSYNTIYKAKVDDRWGCITTTECQVIFEKNKYFDDVKAFVPTSFSPNSDGINDHFTVFGGLDVVEVISMDIYDRWGAHIFHNVAFMPNDESFGWNGDFKDVPVPQGNYTYHIIIKLKDNSEKTLKGEVMVIR